MTYALRFHPRVEDDLLAACRWYEARESGLGGEFARAFSAAAESIQRNPRFSAKVYGEFRRVLLRRFPYAIYYRLNEKQLVVMGLFHCARDPQAIRAALRDRGALT